MNKNLNKILDVNYIIGKPFTINTKQHTTPQQFAYRMPYCSVLKFYINFSKLFSCNFHTFVINTQVPSCGLTILLDTSSKKIRPGGKGSHSELLIVRLSSWILYIWVINWTAMMLSRPTTLLDYMCMFYSFSSLTYFLCNKNLL